LGQHFFSSEGNAGTCGARGPRSGSRAWQNCQAELSKTHLSVGVDDPELHSVDVAPNHAVHGVGTTTTDTDDLMKG